MKEGSAECRRAGGEEVRGRMGSLRKATPPPTRGGDSELRGPATPTSREAGVWGESGGPTTRVKRPSWGCPSPRAATRGTTGEPARRGHRRSQDPALTP